MSRGRTGIYDHGHAAPGLVDDHRGDPQALGLGEFGDLGGKGNAKAVHARVDIVFHGAAQTVFVYAVLCIKRGDHNRQYATHGLCGHFFSFFPLCGDLGRRQDACCARPLSAHLCPFRPLLRANGHSPAANLRFMDAILRPG